MVSKGDQQQLETSRSVLGLAMEPLSKPSPYSIVVTASSPANLAAAQTTVSVAGLTRSAAASGPTSAAGLTRSAAASGPTSAASSVKDQCQVRP